MKNHIILPATEGREPYNPTIKADSDIALTMACEILGLKKEQVVNELVAGWVNEKIEGMNIQTLAKYSNEKKRDTEAQQLARLVTANKVIEAMTATTQETESNEEN